MLRTFDAPPRGNFGLFLVSPRRRRGTAPRRTHVPVLIVPSLEAIGLRPRA